MRINIIIAAMSLAAVSSPALACQTMTAEGVRHYQDAEVRGVVTVTGANSAVLMPEQVRHGVSRDRYEITWEPREKDGQPVFLLICNEWIPTSAQVRGTFHLRQKSRGGPYTVLAAETDEPQ
jgi:hypothetical protein